MDEALIDELIGCTDAELDGRVRAIEVQRRRLDAELAATMGEIERRGAHLDDGHRSVKAYGRATCNWSDAEAGRFARLAAAASAVPGLVEALHTGRIGSAQAHELAHAHANRRVRDRLLEFAPMLLDQAERLSFVEFRACVQRFMALADADGAHRDLDASVANRRARVVDLNGSLSLDAGGGDPLVNAELASTFRRFCEREYDADVAARREQHGDDAELHALPRTASQRSYDAFVAIMRHAVANVDAGRHGRAPEWVVDVLVDHRTFSAVLAEAGLAPDVTLAGERVDPFTGLASPSDLLADLVRDAVDADAGDLRRCETSGGAVLHPHVVLRAALAGHIRRVVLGAASVPIDMGRKVRVFTGPAREAARLLAVRCDHPGCGLPAELCQIDHATEWHEAGPTDQRNAGVRCSGHNREKHRKRWRTRRDAHGHVHTIRADGTIMLPVGVRAPVFPDDDDEGAVDGGLDRHDLGCPDDEERLRAWVEGGRDATERTCRQMRSVALRHAIAGGDRVELAALGV